MGVLTMVMEQAGGKRVETRMRMSLEYVRLRGYLYCMCVGASWLQMFHTCQGNIDRRLLDCTTPLCTRCLAMQTLQAIDSHNSPWRHTSYVLISRNVDKAEKRQTLKLEASSSGFNAYVRSKRHPPVTPTPQRQNNAWRHKHTRL